VWPYRRGTDVWKDVLRAIVYGGGGVALVRWLGGWGVLALPLLIPVVWLVELVALGVSHILGGVTRTR
jgi:hypothetical protein